MTVAAHHQPHHVNGAGPDRAGIKTLLLDSLGLLAGHADQLVPTMYRILIGGSEAHRLPAHPGYLPAFAGVDMESPSGQHAKLTHAVLALVEHYDDDDPSGILSTLAGLGATHAPFSPQDFANVENATVAALSDLGGLPTVEHEAAWREALRFASFAIGLGGRMSRTDLKGITFT